MPKHTGLIYFINYKERGARNEIRTHTPKPALPPQSSVSTNFTIRAFAFKWCAQNRTRTCTTAKPLAPETSASTNSATWAFIK